MCFNWEGRQLLDKVQPTFHEFGRFNLSLNCLLYFYKLAPKYEAECRMLGDQFLNRIRNDSRAIEKRGPSFGGLNATDDFAQNEVFLPWVIKRRLFLDCTTLVN